MPNKAIWNHAKRLASKQAKRAAKSKPVKAGPVKAKKVKAAKAKATKATPANTLPVGELVPFDAIGVAVKQAMLARVVQDGGQGRPMNQAELAKAANVRPVAIRQWLSGARAIRSHMASDCLEALGLAIVAK